MAPLLILRGSGSELMLLPVLVLLGGFFGGGAVFLTRTGGGLGLQGIGALFKTGLFDRDSLFSLGDKPPLGPVRVMSLLSVVGVMAFRKVVSAGAEFMPRLVIPGLLVAEDSSLAGRLGAYKDLVLGLGLAVGGGSGFLGTNHLTCWLLGLPGNAPLSVASFCEELELPIPVWHLITSTPLRAFSSPPAPSSAELLLLLFILH